MYLSYRYIKFTLRTVYVDILNISYCWS